jgi:SAM-dependent methyltransferase
VEADMMQIDDKHLYDQNYFDGYYINDPKREAMYLQERNRITEYFPRGGSVLDVGCGIGGFLDTFDDRWDKYGVEPSDYASEKAAKRGIKILRAVSVGNTESFDVVIFRGSFQHIALPMQTITQAVRCLKKGGLLVFLATPDTDSLVYSIWHNLPALDAPKNWIVPSGTVLTNVLERLGLDVQVIHPYWETPYANPLSDFTKFVVSLFFGWRKFAFPGNMMEIYAIKVKKWNMTEK